MITNTGTSSGTFQLSVSPAPDASLSQASVTLAAGASTEVTITPEADSAAPNDVHIIAKQDGTQVGEDSMTIVSVTFTTSDEVVTPAINNADTPVGMEDRIPPRTSTAISLTVSPDLSAGGQFVTMAVKAKRQLMVR